MLKKERWLSRSKEYYGTITIVYKHGDEPKVLGVELSKTSQMCLAYDNNRRIKQCQRAKA